MSRINSVLGEVPLDKFVATEQGLGWLEDHPSFLELIDRFSSRTGSEDLLNEPENTWIGSGVNSVVWDVDGVAIKVSTPTTGRKARHSDTRKPENLVDQFIFLGALGQHLADHTDGAISVPDQYFALRTPHGNFLRSEQHMIGWTSLWEAAEKGSWARTPQEHTVNEAIKRRIIDTITPKRFRLGLSDIGLGDDEYLHSKNVLVPEDDTTIADTAPLCIIDQPGKGAVGRIGMTMLAAFNPSNRPQTIRFK